MELTRDRALWIYERMRLIRSFEERVATLFADGRIPGFVHLYAGEEAVAVGVCAHLDDGDYITSTHRGHGHCIAKGVPLDEMMAELFGRATGSCKGKGGSMHIADVSRGMLGANGIVGGGPPLASGAALTARILGSQAVAACFFGDGAAEQGTTHEAMNLAAIWKLPVVFVCENNLYGEYSPIATTTPVTELAQRAAAYAIPGARIDGNDVMAVRRAVGEARARAAAGEGPTMIEAMTYRHMGHSRSDPATYRPPGELEEWKQRDPITLFEAALASDEHVPADIEGARSRATAAVADALERALAWPEPDPASRFDYVWAAET